MVAGSYSAGLRGAALADLNRTGFYNAVDDLQARQRALAMQSAEAQAAGLQVNAEPMTGFATPQVDFGQPQRPIATPPAAQPVAPVQQTTEQRTVPIPQPKPAGLGPQGSRLGEFAKGLTGYLPQLAQPPSWYSGTNPGGNLATWLRDPLIATAEGRQSAGVTGAIGGWFLDTVPERQQRAVLQEAANWYDEHGTAFMQGNPQLVEEITKDPVKFYVENVKNVPDSLGMAGDSRNPLAQVDVDPIPPAGRKLLNTLAQPGLEGADYNVIVGGGTFDDFSKHPGVVGITTAQGPSTAAGKYQITGTTWRELQQRYPDLTDFSPVNQDKAAWYLAQESYKANTGRDLEQDLSSGDPAVIGNVGRALSGTWSSLEGGVHQGSRAGQFASMFASASDTAGKYGQPVEKMPDWAKDLPPASQLSQEYQNVRLMQQRLNQQSQVQANNIRTKLARNEMIAAQARKVGDVNRLRKLLDEQDSLRNEAQTVYTDALKKSTELAATESRLATAGALTQLAFGNVGPIEQVFNQLTGIDTRMQLRADGKVDIYYQRAGKGMRLTLKQGELADNMKQAAFSSERQTAVGSAAARGTAVFENELEIRKEVAKALAEAKGNIAEARVKAALEKYDLGTPTTTAEGDMIIPSKSGRGVSYRYKPGVDMGNGIVSAPVLEPIQQGAGLNVGG
jgi:muramidase (phage lysozyme)